MKLLKTLFIGLCDQCLQSNSANTGVSLQNFNAVFLVSGDLLWNVGRVGYDC